MRALTMWVGVAAMGLGGCATTGGSAGGRASDFAGGDVSPLRVVAARMVDSRVLPMVPVHLAPAAPAAGAARVELEGGRSIILQTRENADEGRQVLAQMWTAHGSRLGPPVAISPPDADCSGGAAGRDDRRSPCARYVCRDLGRII
jgi:hypothetical protein